MSDYPYVKIISKDEPSFDFLPEKKIKVFYLEAPLSVANPVNTQISQFNLYHAGLGFECDNIRFVIEFTANYAMQDAVIPKIVNEELVWTNDTSIRFGELSLEYWITSTYLCTITKDQFIKFRDNILKYYIPNNKYYVLCKGSKTSSVYDLLNPLLKSSTCDDFVIYGLNFFKNLGVKIEYVTYPKFTNLNIVGSMKKLDYNENKDEIINFYKKVVNYIDKFSFDLTEENTELIISLISAYYKNFTEIIYYAYDTDDSSKMAYYSFKLEEIPIFSYKKTLVNNSKSFKTFEELVQYKNYNPNYDLKKNYNFNSISSYKIFFIFLGVIIVFIIVMLFIFRKKIKKFFN